MNEKRVRKLNDASPGAGPAVYWMSREMRAHDNWALHFAQALALERKAPLIVTFCLVPWFLEAGSRHYRFMLEGLKQVEEELDRYQISFYLLAGEPEEEIPAFIEQCGSGALVADFDPLKIKRGWKREIGLRIKTAFYEVDAHNIVPCWVASDKQEYGAYTIRGKISKALPEFLTGFPGLQKHRYAWREKAENDYESGLKSTQARSRAPEIRWLKPGERQAIAALKSFLANKLASYSSARNDPVADGQSGLSPYLHFGQLSAQRVALEAGKSRANKASREAFLEELIVRKELSDNFCFYNPDYDSFAGLPEWAKKTLDEHRKDQREYVYSRQEFETAATHDELWNAAQMEMVKKGKMHGYMRMYWGKKILEWSETPQQALETAIYLNDSYELDGRDPNGYAGIAWSIGGVHDRPWQQRPVFGKIRYMNYNGCKRKFNVGKYIENVEKIE